MVETLALKDKLSDQPPTVAGWLTRFTQSVVRELESHVEAVILFGSAAEGRLRATSDVNLLVVLKDFDIKKTSRLQQDFFSVNAAINLHVMFLLRSELPLAAEAFSEKFGDIIYRRRVLYGADPLVGLTISRAARLARLKQVLLNLTLRLRERVLLSGMKPDRLALILAEVAGPIRGIAAGMAELEGRSFAHPKEALADWVARHAPQANFQQLLTLFSVVRENGDFSGDAPLLPQESVEQLFALLAAMSSGIEKVR